MRFDEQSNLPDVGINFSLVWAAKFVETQSERENDSDMQLILCVN